MSVEDRLRSGLEAQAQLTLPRTEEQLEQVWRRRRRRHEVRWGGIAVAATVAAVLGATILPETLGGGEVSPPVASSGLAGTYAVAVGRSATTVREGMVGLWTVTLSESGTLEVDPPPSYERATSGAAYTTDGGQLTTNAFLDHPGCQTTPSGTYAWTIDGTSVQFEHVDDACPARRILFEEQPWERTS